MSFGFSPGDMFTPLRLTVDAYEAWKGACGEYADITSELRTLRANLRRARSDVESPGSLYVRMEDDLHDWNNLLRSCYDAVSDLAKVVKKYKDVNSDSSRRKTWDKIRLSCKNLISLKEKVQQCNASISTFLSITTVNALGLMEPKLNDIAKIHKLVKDVPALKDTVYELQTRHQQRNTSRTAAGPDDDRHLWRQFRHDLREKGFTG